MITMNEFAFPPLPSVLVERILNVPLHFFGGVNVTMSPVTLALPYLTLPSLIRKVSPSTSDIFLASGILIAAPPAIAVALPSLLSGL